ncbi:carboxypeptidase Y-deficient [Diplodia seriata]|uniref:Carboxypeptidase Y-deficient n=1 Tax=Diplodia seriata TaxID=420778 RepID=A0A1S8B494_9PEZI|nr:Vacuolar segregation protein pep7 [Diplodia seriata]
MTSRPGRSLGGGRTLGSAKALSPAADPRPHQHHRNSSLLSPSESSVSLASQSSVSPASTIDPESLTARVNLEHSDNVTAASASSRLVCPICNEEMVTLLQLNRHLDDLHQNLEEVEQDEIQTWFRTQMVKAKKFQPLAVLNQKLKGLDVFESNDSPFLPAPAQPAAVHTHQEAARPLDPEELVSRTHWQRPSYSDACSEPICGNRLGAANGSVNCRKCGRLFCEEHTMYQMKLSRSAQHEPVRGIWCRVCETCYKSREGYNDHNGAERNHTAAFTAIRTKHVDKANLDVGRLEKRLTKLTQLLADPPPPEQQSGAGSLIWPLSGAKAQQRLLEQSIIAWEDDANVLQCPFCQQEFTSYTFRRHHCRLCGRVVCGDPKTGCSTEVGLSVAAQKPTSQVNVDVRMCQDCKHTLFSKSDFARELSNKPRDARSYENLVQFERGIRLLLPRFQKLLAALQDPENPPSPAQLQDATKVRKRLMDAFAQYDTAARRIRDLATESPTQARLQKAVYQQAYHFLSLHMLPLKSLPKILKHASPNGAQAKPNGRANGALAAIKYNDNENSSVASSSSAISTMEAEEKELRERLIVLEEQKFFVQEMIADANRRRKFDEVSSLAQNVEDLSKEIDQINGQLSQLDFAAAYTGDMFPQQPN